MAGKQADIKVGVVTNYDDKGLKKAQTGLSGFKQSIADADGIGAKFKAGASSAFESVGGAAKGLALAGAASFVAFGNDIVNAGVKMASMDAKAKTVFGDGLVAVQKWAEGNAAAMGLTERSAVDAAAGIQDLLIPMGFAREAATDMSLKMLDLGGALSAWSGGTKSAAEVSQIFAKAMLGERDELKSLGISISEADVTARLATKGQQGLTGAALQQAKALATQELIYEKSTDAQKAWSDGSMDATKQANKAKAGFAEMSETLNESLFPAVSKLIPMVTKLVEAVALVPEILGPGGIGGGGFRDVTDAMEGMRPQIEAAGLDFGKLQEKVIAEGLSIAELTKIIDDATLAYDKLHGNLRTAEKSWETQTEWLDKAAAGASETERETRNLTRAFDAADGPIDDTASAVKNFERAIADADLKYRELTGRLDEADAWENVVTKIAEAGNAAKLTGQDARDLTRDIADYVVHTDTIPASKKTEILALLDEGDLVAAEKALADLTRTRAIYLTLTGPGAVTAAGYGVGPHAKGGRIPMSEGLSLVGEQGPELISSPGSTVIPAGQTAAMLGGGVTIESLTINMPPGADGNAIVRELKKFEQRNGPGWRAS